MKRYIIIDWYNKKILNDGKSIYDLQEAKALAFDALIEMAGTPDVVPTVRIEIKAVEW